MIIRVMFQLTKDTDRARAHDAQLPAYESAGAVGMDLAAYFSSPTEELLLRAGGRALIPTGLRVAIPQGFEGQVRPRSGLALKHGVTVLNTPGTIDPDYRGEIGVILHNTGPDGFSVTNGMRIAQLVIVPIQRVNPTEGTELPATYRGEGGFGSTGL